MGAARVDAQTHILSAEDRASLYLAPMLQRILPCPHTSPKKLARPLPTKDGGTRPDHSQDGLEPRDYRTKLLGGRRF